MSTDDHPPMSEEGFFALLDDAVADINENTTNEIVERLGLPSRSLISFLARTTGRVMESPPDEATMRGIGDIFLIGLLIGHKAGEWQEHARTD